MSPLLQQFLVEGRELIQEATDSLLALERNPGEADRVAVVFRAFHTLKGSSGLFEVRPMTRVLHAAEDALVAVRAGRLAIDPALIDTLLEYLDHTARWLTDMEATGTLPADAETRAADLTARLGHGTERGEDRAADGMTDRTGNDVPAAFSDADRMAALASVAQAGANTSLLVATYEPDPRCFFNGDDPLRLMRALDGLMALRIDEPAAWPPAGEMDPFVCALTFRALVVGDEAGVRDVFRFVADQVHIRTVEPASLVRPQGTHHDAARLRTLAAALDGPWNADHRASLRRNAADLLHDVPPASMTASASRWVTWLLDRPDAPGEWVDRLADALRETPELDLADRIRRDVVRAVITEQQHLVESIGPEAQRAGRLASAATVVVNALLYAGEADDARQVVDAHARFVATGADAPLRQTIEALAVEALARRRTLQPAHGSDPKLPEGDRAASGRVLRVDEAKIDRLLNLVSEMIAANSRFTWLAGEAGTSPGSEALAYGLRDIHTALDRLTREMHGTVIQLRMLPVGQVFQRFPRLVRDLSRRLGKQVRLVIEGENTEADKGVIENLFEPLLHLVRNSLDHGLETPEERRAAGKPAESTLVLKAFRSSDRIVIDVRDDGRGIDADAIRRRAAAGGPIDPEDAGSLTEEEAVRLIFSPGFSTRDTASDLSGRGIGMYAVRTMIEKAGGTVSVRSTKGTGTSVRLALPLTMAILRILTVTVGTHRFGIPMDVVRETVRLPRDRIRHVKRHRAFVLHDRVVALHRLARLLDLSSRGHDHDDGGASEGETGGRGEDGAEARILVVDIDGLSNGIEVDAFGERLDIVLKPLEGLLADIPGYLGTTVLGNGQVLLVLDLREILR